MTEKVWFGSTCDRCGNSYRTDVFPNNALCGNCDATKQRVFWRIPEQEAS